MHSVPYIDELAVIAALAVGVTVALARLRLPTVAGLLAAGALAGPYGLALVKSVHAIEVLAEVGVVLLLFTIGLEFSLARLRNIFRQVALGAALQVGLTVLVTALVAVALGEQWGRAVFYGFVFSLSSTAIVLRALTERQELDAPHGRFIVGTLIFQDLCVVPMVLVVPLLGAGGGVGEAATGIALALLKAAVVVVGAVILSRVVVPRALGLVAASRSREVFVLAILALCIGTAWLTSMVGLSLALGAFLGGMVVADTEYSHRAMGDVLPLRDVFVSVFFVSLGMLFDARVVLERPALVGALLLGFLAAKGVLATVSAMAMGFPSRAAWLAGVGLAQFGEFGFVLATLAQEAGVVDAEAVKPLLAAGIGSMFLTPLLVRAAPHVTAGERLLAPLEKLFGLRSLTEAAAEKRHLSGHVIIVGFGVAGRLAAHTLAANKTPFMVLELNVENVRSGRAEGLPIYYGDATSAETLGHAALQKARLLVLLLNDPQAATRIVDTVRRVAPEVPILMRTHYLSTRPSLLGTGAHDVVAEEVEGAVEVISRMLRRVEAPRNLIEERIREVRAETQTTERKLTVPRTTLGEFRGLDDLKIEAVEVRPGSRAAGSSAVQLRLRSETGALMVGVRRGAKLLENPDPNTQLQEGDVVYLVGTSEAMRAAMPTFNPPGATSQPPFAADVAR